MLPLMLLVVVAVVPERKAFSLGGRSAGGCWIIAVGSWESSFSSSLGSGESVVELGWGHQAAVRGAQGQDHWLILIRGIGCFFHFGR